MVGSFVGGVIVCLILLGVATLIRGELDEVVSRNEHVPAIVVGCLSFLALLLKRYGADWIENVFWLSVVKTLPILAIIVILVVFFWNMTSELEVRNKRHGDWRDRQYNGRYDSRRDDRYDSRRDDRDAEVEEEAHYDWEETHYDWEDPNWKG